MMKKTHKVIMLPTEDASPLAKWDGKFITDKEGIDPHVMPTYHLYILSDDEIKEGDWCVHLVTNNIVQSSSECDLSRGQWKKIIATTDTLRVKEIDGEAVDVVPYIPQSLIEYYAKHQPEEVELEYYCEVVGVPNIWSLKLVDNEVVWIETKMTRKELEEKHKMYSREEVEDIAWEIGTYFENIDRNDFKKGFDYVMKKLYKE